MQKVSSDFYIIESNFNLAIVPPTPSTTIPPILSCTKSVVVHLCTDVYVKNTDHFSTFRNLPLDCRHNVGKTIFPNCVYCFIVYGRSSKEYIVHVWLNIIYILVALRIHIISLVRLKYIRKTIGVSEYFVISIIWV